MKIVDQLVWMFGTERYDHMLNLLEQIGRNCYQSESKGEPAKFVEMLIDRGHESILEHVNFHFGIQTDRATANQIVRHRTGKFAQESMRYCNYSKDKFGNEISFIGQNFVIDDICQYLEDKYMELIASGVNPEDARSILPHATKTTLMATFDGRAIRNFLRLRLSKEAQEPIRRIAKDIYYILLNSYPVFVRGIEIAS